MPQFRRWLAVNKPLIILSEDVEHERARTFVGSIVGNGHRYYLRSPGKQSVYRSQDSECLC